MQIHYKEKALLANQYKIERAERNKNWIGRNWFNVLLFGVFISFVGPVWTHQPDGIYRKKAVKALDYSDFDYVGTVAYVFVVYSICITIAYFVWKHQDEKKIRKLKAHRKELENELKVLLDNK
ncbi:hypothetical protein LX97_01626 [Nonlabens dokdonensis]|jgi:ATP/ADP translocase|uniref:Uncharacterized protein n=2 Tax=Nonlabens dokdonensis TaxID=328515 RepID=L7WB66_NONDD|nr:hypothetical protein [Nonlabens dokdonensis]AGC77324.1 hypothetical protein DDD_2196 [Nonlabens dokdonensis DSW-6]PZX40853.1 hypothetical protein LX97_01626 [Nonlabens dokdonensis]